MARHLRLLSYCTHGADATPPRVSALCLPPQLACARAASVWGSQKVISIVRYSAMAVESAVQACSCCPCLAYNVPRPRWQWAWSGRMPSASARVRAWR